MLNELRLACRTLRHTPAFTVSAVIVLTIGIGANTAVFSALTTLLFRPLPYRDADRLVMMGDVDLRTEFRTGTSLARWREWGSRVRSLDQVAAVEPGLTIPAGMGREHVRAARVTTNFFEVTGVTPALGRGFLPGDGIAGAADCALVSQDLWRGLFGSSGDVGGRSIVLGGRRHAVIGVLPAGFRLPLARHDVWLPLKDAPADTGVDRSFRLVGRLRQG